MKALSTFSRRWAIAVSVGSAIGVGALIYWMGTHRDGCVRTLARSGNPKTGQEVVYVWGCVQPQRFRQWSIMATAPDPPTLRVLSVVETRKSQASSGDRWAVPTSSGDRWAVPTSSGDRWALPPLR